jgi:putative membrane protein insertion efficiency factor
MTYAARAIVALIRFYRRAVSSHLGPRCRFDPSCSEYTAGAVTRHGALRGLYLGVRRIARCHPWGRGGVDEVPGHFAWRRDRTRSAA